MKKPTTKEFYNMNFVPKFFPKASSKSPMTLKDYDSLGLSVILWDVELNKWYPSEI